ncbi:MAG: 23S rRNA (guanosine(2251)-2'-O)-methyltransferase RlmB [Parachlamydiales bacterium]|nr:23S rRNA (guanosine(2251)-2'-O)-methyltransferase RlmB [Parachlamydiales bacterium]
MKSTMVIMGRNCLKEILLHASEKIIEVFIADSEKHSRKKNDLIRLIEEKNISYTFVPKNALTSMVNSDSHQSFAAKILEDNVLSLSDLKNDMVKKEFYLALDTIYDPHNFGAIMRSCEGFGVDGIIFSKNRGVGITPVVAKASSGAVAFLSLYEVSNLFTTLQVMQEHGFDIVTTTCVEEKGITLERFRFPQKSVLVMGSEELGVSSLIEKNADHFLYIPMSGMIRSFNVSIATSICLYAKHIQKIM